MDTFLFILSTITIGLLCSIPSLVLGYWLDKKGFAAFQPYLTPFLFIGVLFWMRLAAPNANLVFFICWLILFSPAIYSQDLWFTYKRGKWWWNQNDSEKTELGEVNSGKK